VKFCFLIPYRSSFSRGETSGSTLHNNGISLSSESYILFERRIGREQVSTEFLFSSPGLDLSFMRRGKIKRLRMAFWGCPDGEVVFMVYHPSIVLGLRSKGSSLKVYKERSFYVFLCSSSRIRHHKMECLPPPPPISPFGPTPTPFLSMPPSLDRGPRFATSSLFRFKALESSPFVLPSGWVAQGVRFFSLFRSSPVTLPIFCSGFLRVDSKTYSPVPE